jgi:hypothetical protein
MWENSQHLGRAVRVGKLVDIERDVELNGKRCTRYSFALENEDGTAGVHRLEVFVREEGEHGEILDFWNFGW